MSFRPCGSSVGISEIVVVGVDDNHARKKGQGRLYCTAKVVQQTPKEQIAVPFPFQLADDASTAG